MKAAPTKATYFCVWLALMILLGLTWGVARFDFGIFNTAAALFISVVKMVMVILFFMHVRHHSRLTWLFAGAGFVWLLFMLVLTMSDYLTRQPVTPYAKEAIPRPEPSKIDAAIPQSLDVK